MISIYKSIFFTVIILGTATFAWCENSNEKPKEFYANDYAGSTFEHDTTKSKEKRNKKDLDKSKHQEESDTNPSSPLPDASFTELKTEEREEALLPTENDESPIDFEKTLKVNTLGVILNTDDKEHAIEKLHELAELATQHDWTIGAIYAVGDLANIALTKEMRMLRVRGAMLTQRDTVPKRYEGVKLSPTWLVATNEGEVLLEATGSLKRHFNSRGDLLLPKQELSAAK